MSKKVYAPWTPLFVAHLNAYQYGPFHPYTCGVRNCRGQLEATTNGWVCPYDDCDYTQNWAHQFTATMGADVALYGSEDF